MKTIHNFETDGDRLEKHEIKSRAVLRGGATALPERSKGRQNAGQSPDLSIMKSENVEQNTGIDRKEEKRT